jgi:molybdenum-dependent DNA-binding transcriptional regulator ModE
MGTTGITRRQRKAINAILTYPTLLQAAQASGIPYRTLWRWVNENDAFKKALQEAENQLFEEAMRRLLSMQAAAIDALQQVLTDPNSRQSDKLRAVEMALDHVLRLRSAIELEERLKLLEKRLLESEVNHENRSQN